MPRSLAGSIRKGSDYMSEEEKNPTTGLEDTSPENGMGGVSEEPPKKKLGRPPKQPGDPPGRYVKKDEKIVKKEQPMQKANSNYLDKNFRVTR